MKALVTGASRGIGRGIALALAKQGYDVFVTGRSVPELTSLQREAIALARECTIIPCDHLDFEQTVRAFASTEAETFDIVVNNAWGGYERMVEENVYTWEQKFWQQPDHRWTSMMDVGVRTAFLCSRSAARRMVEARRGLLVNISFWAAQRYWQNVIYGVSKAATDKMTADMAVELKPFGVSVVSLYPGLVRTEAVMANADYFDLSNSESPEFAGLVIGALAQDLDLAQKSGRALSTAVLAAGYGIVDLDGKAIIPDQGLE